MRDKPTVTSVEFGKKYTKWEIISAMRNLRCWFYILAGSVSAASLYNR